MELAHYGHKSYGHKVCHPHDLLDFINFFAEVIKQCHGCKVNAVILKQTVFFCFVFYCGPFLPKAKSKFVLNVSHDCRALQALVNADWLPSAQHAVI